MNGVETCTGIHNKFMRLRGNFTKNHTLELTEMVKIIVITSPTPPNFFRSFASVLLTAESAILNQGQFFLLLQSCLRNFVLRAQITKHCISYSTEK